MNDYLKMRVKLVCIVASCLLMFTNFVISQNQQLDSLRRLLKTDKADTNKVNHLIEIAWELADFNLDSALLLSNEALKLSISLKGFDKTKGWQIGIANSLHRKASIYDERGEYKDAIKFYEEALKEWEQIISNSETPKKVSDFKAGTLSNLAITYHKQGEFREALNYYNKSIDTYLLTANKIGIAAQLNNIGSIYVNQGNYPKALECFFKVLRTSEELQRKKQMLTVLGNIGIIYKDLNKYEIATKYTERALKLARELGSKRDIGINLGNMGVIQYQQKKLSLALSYYYEALKIKEEIGNKRGIVITLGNIGSALKEQGDSAIETGNEKFAQEKKYPLAFEYYQKALAINEDIGNKEGILINLANIGVIYTLQKKYDLAKNCLTKSAALAKEVGDLYGEMEAQERLSEMFAAQKQYKMASQHFVQYRIFKDSLFNDEKSQELTRSEMNYEFEIKEATERANQEKKEAIAVSERKKKNLLLGFLSIIAIAILFTIVIVLRALKVTRKQKNIIELQKALVEEKQKEILDSIYYARRIQRSLLPNENYIKKNLLKLRSY